jgi:deoxycytidylate deaminase
VSGPCAKQRVVAEITTPDGGRFYGENLCFRPQQTCPRQDMPTGKGYHLCRSICVQSGHAEINALAAAGDKARGATMTVFGHSYACESCTAAAEAAGIVEIRYDEARI